MERHRRLEKGLAVASFVVATTLSFTSMALSPDHEITANVLLAIAQFLTFAATILGIDYKFSHVLENTPRIEEQQPT